MAIIQEYPELLDYVNATLRFAGDSDSFLCTFCRACLRADADNFEIIKSAFPHLQAKYPARAELLERERRDRA